MRRDMELIRQIAFAVESANSGVDSETLNIAGFGDAQIGSAGRTRDHERPCSHVPGPRFRFRRPGAGRNTRGAAPLETPIPAVPAPN